MTRNDFYQFVKNKNANLLQLLERKAAEYATDEDAFHNFKKGKHKAADRTEEKYALGLRAKHLQSMEDIIVAAEKDPNYIFDPALIEMKFGDDLAYNLLIWAMISEKMAAQQLTSSSPTTY